VVARETLVVAREPLLRLADPRRERRRDLRRNRARDAAGEPAPQGAYDAEVVELLLYEVHRAVDERVLHRCERARRKANRGVDLLGARLVELDARKAGRIPVDLELLLLRRALRGRGTDEREPLLPREVVVSQRHLAGPELAGDPHLCDERRAG